MTNRTCSVDGCDRPHYARSWCHMHYGRWRANGTTDRRELTLEDRFWSKVDKTGDCWIWLASVDGRGYGQFNYGNGTNRRSHRLSLELTGAGVPADLHVDHICGNRRCVKPAHLRPVTSKQNLEHVIKLRKDNTSGYLGVTRRRNKWHARVVHDGEVFIVGNFDDIEEAAEAARLKRNELFTHNNRDRAA